MLTVRGLSRAYGEALVVDEVTFDVRPGRLTGFVGANGAGKTTTMRMLMGVLAPTAGEVLWDGAPITTEQRRTFGYMPEERGLYPRMSLVDQLVFLARLHGLDKAAATERARHLLDHFGLDERRDDLLDSLSLGNQQRVQVAAALIHRPTALILDEPFSGLDPLAVDSMVELLNDEVGPDVPVLFSSHQLELVERLCDDLVILSGGRVVVAGATDELREGGPLRYRVVVDDPTVLESLPGATLDRRDGDAAFVTISEGDPADLLAHLTGRTRVSEFHRHVEPLAHVFREATR
ncbi:ABC transporter ATP-binding protein [Nocardioides currus]|uniref:ABC transporter ATP-binding protein n=1 Tax=Nocardioides currus TaxID=2133958 RepID=A0A2R7YTW8_9ACTN|nr:ATP-binding cassette domain-containing protein [Nocardioides currus]PUA79763.1 ABC transporter ATP-binding protein [Nocardioides currus]